MTDRGGTTQVQNPGGYGGNSAAMSLHSGIGALGPSASMSQYGGSIAMPGQPGLGLGGANPLLNMSTTRSEINLSSLQVNNPLLT